MKFCKHCDNMLYMKVSENDPNILLFYCRKCGEIDNDINSQGMCICSSANDDSVTSFDHVINEYTKLDPTLPRVKNVLCPNNECSSNTEKKEKEVIYVRYDKKNMKYLYLCCNCDNVWKSTK
tara:strand:+ start:2810 stop:3175 length:366 start_codon:yes stop_codon:yes gene_type:complete